MKLSLISLLRLKSFQKPVIFAIAIVLFVIVNVLLNPFPLRIDLSKGSAYSLSDSTKKILRELDDIVSINVYISSDLPTRLQPMKTDVTSLLQEFKKYGGSKVNLRIQDPKKDSTAEKEVKETGIPEIPVQQLEKDKYQVINTYFGSLLRYGDKTEIIPQLTDLENLEYNMISLIYKMTSKATPKIGLLGFATDQFSEQENAGFEPILQLINQQFSTEFIPLPETEPKSIDKSISTVLLYDNENIKYNDAQINVLKEYVKQGGKLIAFVNGVWGVEKLTPSPAEHNLFSFLTSYGITINKDLVLSSSSELVNFGNGSVQFLTPYPFWIKTNVFNTKLSYFGNISTLSFPWTSSITLKKSSNITYHELVSSTENSWTQQEGLITLNPQEITQPDPKNFQKQVVMVEATKKNEGTLVVLPSSRFINAKYINRSAGNIELVFNILTNLASQGVLSGIRSRQISFYPIPEIPDYQKDLFKYVNIIFLPLLFSLYGAVRLIRRR